MDLLDLNENELGSVLAEKVGRKYGLNISIIVDKETNRYCLFLTLKTLTSCHSMIFDDPVELKEFISSLEEAKKAMETPPKEVN